MRIFFTLILSLTLFSPVRASTESKFIKEHILTFHELNLNAQSFERNLLNISNKDTALKYIDNYSLVIEKALSVYSKYKKSDNKLIREVSKDLSSMLKDIMYNNYEVLGKLIKYSNDQRGLQLKCEGLVRKNQFVSNFLRDVSIGICMTTVNTTSKRVSESEQLSNLTEKERNDINNLLTEKFGMNISNAKKEKTITPFEYSCVAIYEFLNMTWTFKNES